MPKRRNRSQTKPSLKRTKLASDVQAVRWSDLNYDIVWDIFNHLSTVQKTFCRRVSSNWCSILSDQISSSSVVSLRYSDLKYWRTIFYPPIRETRQATRERKVKLVTDKTRWTILDFENAKLSCYAPLELTPILLTDGCPLEDVINYHPQICRIVLYRYFIAEAYAPVPEYCFLHNFGCAFGSPRSYVLREKVTVMILKCGQAVYHKPAWNPDREERRIVRSSTMRWPKLSLINVSDGRHYWDPLMDQSQKAYWPYPPDQLAWLENCLNLLPSDDALFRYLQFEQLEDLDYELERGSAIMFRGHAYQKTAIAFCARYLTTFRQHLNLPPPPPPPSSNLERLTFRVYP